MSHSVRDGDGGIDVNRIGAVRGQPPEGFGKFGISNSRAWSGRLASGVGEPGGKRHSGPVRGGEAPRQIRRNGEALLGDFDGVTEQRVPGQFSIPSMHKLQHSESPWSANGGAAVRETLSGAGGGVIGRRGPGQSVKRPDALFLCVTVECDRAAAQTGRLRFDDAKHHLSRDGGIDRRSTIAEDPHRGTRRERVRGSGRVLPGRLLGSANPRQQRGRDEQKQVPSARQGLSRYRHECPAVRGHRANMPCRAGVVTTALRGIGGTRRGLCLTEATALCTVTRIDFRQHAAKTSMPIDIERARRDTPAADHILHFNNAGAALMPAPVLEAQLRHLRLEADTGGYEAAAAEDDRIEAIYDSIARLLNADRDEIALVENATVAWDMAFHSVGFAAGDRILTAEAEYVSNYIGFLQVAKRSGVVIDVVPSDAAGEIDVEALEGMIDRRVRLIAITHVPSSGGLVNPAEAVGRIARAHGILYLLDACQSAGQLPIDVAAINCDMLSATGRKYLRGPRGTGFLYVRRAVLDRLEPPFLDLQAATRVELDRYEIRPDARRFENWERNVAGLLGLGAAVDYALDWGLADIEERIGTLAADLRRRLAEIPGVTIRDQGRRRCGIVTFTVEGKPARDLVAALRQQRINCHTSGPGSTLLDARARRLPDLVRASVHYYNTEAEVARFVAAVAALA